VKENILISKKVDVMKIICIVIMLCFCLNLFVYRVFAITVFYLTDGSQYLDKASEVALEAIDTKSESDELFLTVNSGESTGYYFNKDFYDTLSNKEKRELIKAFVNSLNNQPMNTADKQVIHNAMRDLNDKYITAEIGNLLNSSGGNMLTAVSILKPFTGTVGIILGVVAILLMTSLVIMTVIDLACMGIPMFQVNSNGEKPKFMSVDAFKALKEAQEHDSNVYWLYFKRRFVTYIILSICILYLISGRFGELFAAIADALPF